MNRNQKPGKVFRVYMPSGRQTGRQIYVIARHGKGARTIAMSERRFGTKCRAEEVESHFMTWAVNYEEG